MIKRLRELLESNKSFAFETTASGTNYLKHIKSAKEKGYEIHLTYLWLASPDLAVKRVASRVAQGGHHIPEITIRRRYYNGLHNVLKYYLPLVDKAIILDNSNSPVKLIAVKNHNFFEVEHKKNWETLQELANGQKT